MRKIFSATLLAALAAVLATACSSFDSDKRPPKPKSVVASADPSAPPMAWLEDGELKGTGPDCLKIVLMADEITPKTSYEGPWPQVLEKVKDGKVDIVSGVFKTAQREEYMEFTIPYATVPIVVCVKKGKEFPFTRWDDLKGRAGVMGEGESYGEDFDAFAKQHLKIERMPLSECFKALVDEKADYLVVNHPSGLIASWRAGMAEDLHFLEVPVTSQSYHFGISKKSPLIYEIPKFNERIRALKIEGTPEQKNARYIILWKNRVILHSVNGLQGNETGY